MEVVDFLRGDRQERGTTQPQNSHRLLLGTAQFSPRKTGGSEDKDWRAACQMQNPIPRKVSRAVLTAVPTEKETRKLRAEALA